jgi:hypothetical protein
MNPDELFAALLARPGKVRGSEYSSLPAYAQLIKAGLIEETGVVSSILCDDCGNPHDATVVYEDKLYGHYCPDLGFIPKARSDLIAAQPNLSVFVAEIADHLNCKRRKSTALEGDTWRIGAIDTPAGDVVLYLTPQMQDAQDVKGLQSALASEVKSPFGIVLTSIGTLSVAPYITLQVQDIIDFEPVSGKLTVVLGLEGVAGVPQKNNGGRPNEYTKPLNELSAVRQKEGRTLKGRNKEATALRGEYKFKFPNQNCPSLSRVKTFVTNYRSGS